jgi:16S rRNA (guanine527-N7)-methyltransferase
MGIGSPLPSSPPTSAGRETEDKHPVTSRVFQERLQKRARKAGFAVSPELGSQLEEYFSLLTRWNAKINLTAFNLREPRDEAFDRLLVEPLIASQHVPTGPTSVVDIGSGSGSPAIPLRLAAPQLRLTMVEAKTRKAVFLIEALRHLNISNARVETARFEQLLTRPELHEAFDLLTIRAVRVESATLLTLQALLKAGGQLLWFQGASREISSALLAFPLVLTREVPLVEALGSRLVILTKQRHGAGGERGPGAGAR